MNIWLNKQPEQPENEGEKSLSFLCNRQEQLKKADFC